MQLTCHRSSRVVTPSQAVGRAGECSFLLTCTTPLSKKTPPRLKNYLPLILQGGYPFTGTGMLGQVCVKMKVHLDVHMLLKFCLKGRNFDIELNNVNNVCPISLKDLG